MKENRRQDIITYVFMLGIGVWFYFLPGEWLCIEDDSIRYLSEGGEGVLPGYPAFLAFFRLLFSEQYFLHAVVIAQSLLAVICTFLFVVVLKGQFHLRRIECILLYLFSMLPFSIYLPESGITHQIMTEGITYALFYLFFSVVIKTVWTLEYKWYFGSVAMALLLGLTRSQMLFLIVVCVILLLWIIYKKAGGKALLGLCMCCLVLLGCVVGLFWQRIENSASQLNTVIMARGFFEADKEDVELFDDGMMQEIFLRTYELADENGRRYEHAKPGLYMWQDLVYDRMNLFALQAIGEYDEKYPDERSRNEASIIFELGFKTLLRHFDRYFYHSIRLMMPSFIASVFFQIEPIYLLCHFVALFIYLFAVSGSVFVGKTGGDRKVVELMVSIVSIMLIMIVMINMLFIGLQRYMVYGMGIFYCAMYLLCKEIVSIFLRPVKLNKGERK